MKRGRKIGSKYMYCKSCEARLCAAPGGEKICSQCGKKHTAKQVDQAIKAYSK